MKNRNNPACNAVALRAGTFATILLALASFAQWPAPKAFGVVPAPDGGYPGGNTAEGTNALLSRTTGLYNSAFGIYSLLSLTDGNFCTGVGAGTLLVNTADQNTATGAGALFSNTTGTQNTANGAFALFSNIAGNFNTATGSSALLNNTASFNTANGYQALMSNTSGQSNTAIGFDALFSNTDGLQNTATGFGALATNTHGSDNTATGAGALISNDDGNENTAIGAQALQSNQSGIDNTATGFQALFSNTAGLGNTANGFQALLSNDIGNNNTANGTLALASNTTGDLNTANGQQALNQNITGGSNVAVGASALFNNTAGDNNIAIGFSALFNNTASANLALRQNAGAALTTGNSNIDIGASVVGVAGEANTLRIGQSIFTTFIAVIRGVTTGNNNAIPVLIDSAGQLGTLSSSRRFKHDIKPMDNASESILAVKPVTFHYKVDTTNTPQYGFIAEEVAEINPDLVVRDENGEIYTVRYDAVNAMLLNEFLKEHKAFLEEQCKVQEQERTIAQMKKGMDALVARIEEQDSKIQKVSDRVEMSKAPAQTVVNSQ